MVETIAPDIVVVKWHDARFYSGIYTKEDCEKHNMCLFESLGYIISKDETTVRITAELDNEGKYRGITLIPTGSVVSIEKLINVSRETI